MRTVDINILEDFIAIWSDTLPLSIDRFFRNNSFLKDQNFVAFGVI